MHVSFLMSVCEQILSMATASKVAMCPSISCVITLPLFDKSKLYLITPEGGRCTELAIYMLREAGFDAYLLDDDQAVKMVDKVG